MISFRPLEAEEVEVRVNQCTENGCSLLLYKTSRTDVMLLNETVGADNWQCDYKQVGNMLFCGMGIKTDGEWVWKWDTGAPSNMEADKGHASDGLKRAGFRWGIGIELYTAPRIWVGAENCNIKHGRNGKPQCYDDFRVTEMDVEDSRISRLTVVNMSKRGLVVYGQGKGKKETPKSNPVSDAKRVLWAALTAYGEKHGRTPEDVLEDVRKRPEWESQQGSAEWLMSVAREYEELANG